MRVLKVILGVIGLFLAWLLANNGLEAMREANINGEMYQLNEVRTLWVFGSAFLIAGIMILGASLYAIISGVCRC